MKRICAVILMVLMMTTAVFAEAHKKQKVVWCKGGPMYTDMLTISGGKAVIKDAKMPGVVIPDGWHVEHIWVIPSNIAPEYTIIFVLEEN